MKTSLFTKSLIAILVILMVAFSAVGCFSTNEETTKKTESTQTTRPTQTTQKPDVSEDPEADKTALNAEIALEVAEQGDYTAISYDVYAEKLALAKAIANNEKATQEEVDEALAALTTARLALKIRPVEEVEGANKEFRMISGDVKEIVLADYVNTNLLSNITYNVTVSNAVLEESEIADGKFTLTAGAVREETPVTVTITVSYNGEEKLAVELTVTITNDVSPVLKQDNVLVDVDKFDITVDTLILDFSDNVMNAGNLELTYSVMCDGAEVSLDGSSYTLALGEYGDTYTYTEYTVTVTYTANGVDGTLTYTYKLGLRDTSAYRVQNGNLENGLEGWEMKTTEGEEPFGVITDASTFWNENYPMFNVGKYFGLGNEASKGILASSYFTVNSDWATFMLGSAGNHNVYITLEDENGNVLALFRNTKFADLPGGEYSYEEKYAMIGETVFALNFVTYKVDMTEYDGMKLRFVVHDYATAGFGFACFDELNTYCESEPEGTLAENLLANKEALNAEIALEVTEQGDYTADSFNAYVAKLNEAKALLGDIAATQATVDAAVNALKEAYASLTVRPVEEVAGANKSFGMVSATEKTINLADFVNTNELSGITFTLEGGELLTLSEIADGKFTITAGTVSEATNATVTIAVSYKGEVKLTVTLTVEITNDVAPTLNKGGEVYDHVDLYGLGNKEIKFDLAESVDNRGNLALTFFVNGEKIEGSEYTHKFNGTYNDEYTTETVAIRVEYEANGEKGALEYIIKIDVKDTTAYRLVNGGFENGLDGWKVVGNIGAVSSDRTYWNEGIEFGMDGDKMFSAYATNDEAAVGTLTSSTFVVGGSGFVTFKVGAMRDGNYVYVDVVDAETKQILARYNNGLWTDADLSGCKLVAYKANLSAFEGREVFFRISDNADSGYGLFFADSFVTYYENEPEGFNAATPVNYTVSGTIYDVFNGGFEINGLAGWWNNGEIGVVTNANGYWADNIPYGKDGEYLFTGVESFGADTMREGNKGTLTSSVFEIGGTGYISFMLGGAGNEQCYVQVIDVVTGEVLARFRQQAQQDAKLIQYVADLSAHIGKTVRIQVVDYATSGWGCVSFDNVVTYYASTDTLPAGETANNIFNGNYEVTNGSFENGLDGWHMNIWDAGAQNTLGWVESSEHDAGWYTKNDDRKDGNNLFTFCRPDGTNCENTKGELVSSTFTLKQNTYVSFRFGAAGTRDVRIELVRADGTVIATFYNEAEGKVNTEMFAYYYMYTGETADCFFRVVDDSVSNYGCFVVDDFRANLENAPEGFMAAKQ